MTKNLYRVSTSTTGGIQIIYDFITDIRASTGGIVDLQQGIWYRKRYQNFEVRLRSIWRRILADKT